MMCKRTKFSNAILRNEQTLPKTDKSRSSNEKTAYLKMRISKSSSS